LELDLTKFDADHAKSFAKVESDISIKKLNKRVFLVAGPVMTKEKLDCLKTPKHYKQFLDENATKIARLMKEHAPK
jgi:hypothetical protein